MYIILVFVHEMIRKLILFFFADDNGRHPAAAHCSSTNLIINAAILKHGNFFNHPQSFTLLLFSSFENEEFLLTFLHHSLATSRKRYENKT